MEHSSQPPIYSVVGPTASGKTKYALQLAQQLLEQKSTAGVVLISADSRQVYKGLEIISGADIPEGFLPQDDDSFAKGKIVLHGVSMIETSQEWSVAHFVSFAREILLQCKDTGKAAIIVGGTGLYHKKLFEAGDALFVPPNQELRTSLSQLSVSELQGQAEIVDIKKYTQLNNSDRNNPRRLIRLIEVAQFKEHSQVVSHEVQEFSLQPEKIFGLTGDLETLQERIYARVVERFSDGAVSEVEQLIVTLSSADHAAHSCLGVREIVAYLDGEIDVDECKRLWALHEFQYAKRQLTWWKKMEKIYWVI